MENQHNIHLFNQVVAYCFSGLYTSFPIPTTIDLKNINTESEVSKIFFKSTVVWLKDTGYIVFSNVDASHTRVFNCVLTAKGLEVLNATPDGLKIKHTLGDTLGECLKQGAKEQAVDTVKKILGIGISLITGQ